MLRFSTATSGHTDVGLVPSQSTAVKATTAHGLTLAVLSLPSRILPLDFSPLTDISRVSFLISRFTSCSPSRVPVLVSARSALVYLVYNLAIQRPFTGHWINRFHS